MGVVPINSYGNAAIGDGKYSAWCRAVLRCSESTIQIAPYLLSSSGDEMRD